MKKIILTVIITIAFLIAGFILFIESGTFDISQLTPHNSLTLWVINTTRKNSINKRYKDIQVPNLNDTALFAEGFSHYNEMCTSCHGAPGVEAWEMADGLYPKPPLMYKSTKEMDPGKTFWIIKNGIKMTSMPGYGPSHSDDKIWAITAFLTKKLPNMTPGEYKAWQKKYASQEAD